MNALEGIELDELANALEGVHIPLPGYRIVEEHDGWALYAPIYEAPIYMFDDKPDAAKAYELAYMYDLGRVHGLKKVSG